MESMCEKIYSFLNSKIRQSGDQQSFINELGKRQWLFLHGQFVQSKKVAFTSKGDGAPFLFTLPISYQRDYGHLLKAMNIQQSFNDEDYIGALYELESTKKGCSLTEDELQIAVYLCDQIDAESSKVKHYIGQIPLPDTDCILRRSEDVVVNLSLWLEDPNDNRKVHERIAPQKAHKLGAKSLKTIVLKKCSSGIAYGESFGQREKLTDRLKGILDGYPVEGILKELVQNADDAQASEIHFIYDTRSLGCERVAIEEKTCKEVQGPALCVYNDRPFTKKDLDGFKNLGVGSKGNAVETTGRYGIGFNSVYNLTDCPSFLSNNETLVILDPHCRYVFDGDQGKLFKVDANLRKKFPDTLNGYLSDHFNLECSTMFRFPLRLSNHESEISPLSPNMNELMQAFQKEARKSLLFLNHVKKITLSRIDAKNKLKTSYQVEIVITSEDEKKRQKLAKKVGILSSTPTGDIDWEGINYTLKIKMDNKVLEKWLIHKCIGSSNKRGEVPDGRKLGLFPRGGIAARLWTRSKNKAFNGMIYCFLPLPENYTGLPVHVNGHFALDTSRRGLWAETDGKGIKCDWNYFLKSCVLTPAYVAVIHEARNHFFNDKNSNYRRYYALFPTVNFQSPWKSFTTGFYNHLAKMKAEVLPFLVPKEPEEMVSTSSLPSFPESKLLSTFGGIMANYFTNTVHFEHQLTKWVCVDEVFFKVAEEEEDFLHLLIRIGLPVLLDAPFRIYNGFCEAGSSPHEVSPMSVIRFLADFQSENSTCKIGMLPRKLETTAIERIQKLLKLIEYCHNDENFKENLEGLPLLLTQDGNLRVFDSCQVVYRSEFGDLFPTQLHRFVHCDIIQRIPSSAETKKQVVWEFTPSDLASLLPDVFTNDVLQAIENSVSWTFPNSGVLSEAWFKRFWNFLQKYAKPAPNEDFVSLFSEWPVIPTLCGKLVKFKNAKTVLDMTTIGNEVREQQNVRKFLNALGCPVLNKDITRKNGCRGTAKAFKMSCLKRKAAVTDRYVSHPHNVSDVLTVLRHHVTSKYPLDVLSSVSHNKVLQFLKFVQDNRNVSKHFELQKIRRLPFHKTFNGEFVSLVGQHASYVLIPSGVPTQQLDELQKRIGCLFLNSDALPTLAQLYEDLGVEVGENIAQFYVDYVLQHFDVFSRETQIKHLVYIRDEVYPALSRQDKFRLKQISKKRCIPDENGGLDYPCELFDPTNEVFKVMFQSEHNKLPPELFRDEAWLSFLKDVGIQVHITPELFLQFAKTVALCGKRSSSDENNHMRSDVLVKSLFSEKTLLLDEAFLKQVSQIEFIAPAEVDEELSLIHKQYQCTQDGCLPFNKFSNAVPWQLRYLAWTTAPILAEWLNSKDQSAMLDVACSGPGYTQVIAHLQNVATSYSAVSVDSRLINHITKLIYQFLTKTMQSCCCLPDNECCTICIDIVNCLSKISCIFVQEDQTFVRANQLVFRLSDRRDFRPFLYPVPRDLSEFGHFLKQLGATEKPTPLQMVFVLNAIREKIGDATIATVLEEKVKSSVLLLLELLYRGEPSQEIHEIYLPTRDKRLYKSYEMICKVPPRFIDKVMENFENPILLPLQECGLKKPSDNYIDAFPKSLRPAKFENVVREEVDSECKILICPKANQLSLCDVQKNFQNLLQSNEFQEGLKRLLVQNHRDPRDFEEKIKTLQRNFKTKCIGFDSIKIHMINRNTNQRIDHLTESSYALKIEKTWLLYMQHDLKDVKKLLSIVACVNKVLGDCIQKENGLLGMISCASPNEISTELNRLNITQSTCIADGDFDEIDDGLETSDERNIRPDVTSPKRSSASGGGGGRGGGGFGLGGGGFGHIAGGGFGQVGGGDGSPRPGEEVEDKQFFPKNDEEAERWLQQSKSDLKIARWLLESDPPFCAHACFLSQQIVEKFLKALLFSHDGISGPLLMSHKLDLLADELFTTTARRTQLFDEHDMRLVHTVSGYYLNTRYPNCQPGNRIPAEAFDIDEAKKAVDAAAELLERVQQRF